MSGSTEKELIKDGSGAAYMGSTYTVRPEDSRCAIMVKAEAPGYWEMGSAFTSVIEVIAPSEPPEVTVIDYQTVEVTGKGGVMEDYEFAYAKPGGTKIEVPHDPANPVTQTITGLEADTAYEFYSRIPGQTDGETTMAASDWSAARTATTGKIPLEGEITVSGETSVDQTVVAEMPNTNLQTGTWSAELVKAGETSRTITDKLSTADYRAEYVVQKGDVGWKVKFIFTPTAPYGGEAKTAETAEIEAAIQAAPAVPTFSSATDSEIYLATYADDLKNTIYEYGLKGPHDSEIRTLTSLEVSLAGNRIVIRNLTRNTSYEIYARRKITEGYQVGRWSAGLTAATKRTDIISLSPVFSSGELQVEGTVTVTAPVISGTTVTGSWKLERIEEAGSENKASLSGYSISDNGQTLTYVLQPSDVSYLLQATFVGSGNFEGNAVAVTSQNVQNKEYAAPSPSDFSIVSWNDSSVTVSIAEGKEGTFQFGYQTGTEERIACDGSLQQGGSFIITPLKRDTGYNIYMKRLAETGYTDSDWSPASQVTLAKTGINGTLQIQGSASVGETLQVSYEPGNYIAPADSDTGGSFTWRVVDSVGNVETHAGTTYQVQEADRGKTVSAVYEPPSSSKFTGSVEKRLESW